MLTPAVTVGIRKETRFCGGPVTPTVPNTSTRRVTGTWRPAEISERKPMLELWPADSRRPCASSIVIVEQLFVTPTPSKACNDTVALGRRPSSLAPPLTVNRDSLPSREYDPTALVS